jgi:hypothetical protein
MRIKFQTMRQRARRTAAYQRAIDRAMPPAQPPVLGSQADWDQRYRCRSRPPGRGPHRAAPAPAMTTRTAYLLLLLVAWLAAVYDATRLGEWQRPPNHGETSQPR